MAVVAVAMAAGSALVALQRRGMHRASINTSSLGQGERQGVGAGSDGGKYGAKMMTRIETDSSNKTDKIYLDAKTL